MVNGIKANLRIDLNMLRGDRIVTCRDFLVGGGHQLPDLQEGDLVRVVESEGDSYLATVENVGGENNLLVSLRLHLDSLEYMTKDIPPSLDFIGSPLFKKIETKVPI